MAPWAPLKRSARQEATLEGGGEGGEAAGRPPPPSLPSVSLLLLSTISPMRTHRTEEGRVPLLTRVAQGEECPCGRVWAGCPGQGCNSVGGLPRPSRVSPALVPVSCHTAPSKEQTQAKHLVRGFY